MSKGIGYMPGHAYPLGMHANGRDLEISATYRGRTNCGICLFSGNKQTLVLFDESCRTGNLYSAVLKDANNQYDSYLLYEDGTYFCDPYARKIIGLESFGMPVPQQELRCRSALPPYDWTGDIRPRIPYEKSLMYCLNIRAFTMQAVSMVPKALRGTFLGCTYTIPYLKSLGVTTVELMPIYEIQTGTLESDRQVPYLENGTPKSFSEEKKVNLWGFSDGYYFAARASFAHDKEHPCIECKDMIRTFHENGMEVVLQFYFAPGASKNLMIDCIRYWVSEYHIDGIHLKSENIPVDMIASDPMLSDVKIFAKDTGVFPSGEGHRPMYLSHYDDTFAFLARRFLKADDSSLQPFVDRLLSETVSPGDVHYICNYDGFTLRDLVTYEHKQNLANGENNADGRNDNCSWNCGIEGESRKRTINGLRKRQMKNALTMVLLTRQIPLLYAGDEMGNTQQGNNNPYCQDNPTGWTDWNKKGKYNDITDYVRFLTALRVRLFHTKKDLVPGRGQMRTKGYPPVSFHGTEAWRPDFSDNSHSFGVLFCVEKESAKEPVQQYIYVTLNLYWNETLFAMPALPSGMVWQQLSDTSQPDSVLTQPLYVSESNTKVKARSICIFEGVESKKTKQHKRSDSRA